MGLASEIKLGQYEVLELIGKGGMGDAYHGYEIHLKRDGARKFLAGHVRDDSESGQRFLRGRVSKVGRSATASGREDRRSPELFRP